MQPRKVEHFFFLVVVAGLLAGVAAGVAAGLAAGVALGVVATVAGLAAGAAAGVAAPVPARPAFCAAFAGSGGSSNKIALTSPGLAVKVIDLEPKPFFEALQSWLPGVSSTPSAMAVTFLPSHTTHSHASGWHVKRARAGPLGTTGAAETEGAGATDAAALGSAVGALEPEPSTL